VGCGVLRKLVGGMEESGRSYEQCNTRLGRGALGLEGGLIGYDRTGKRNFLAWGEDGTRGKD